MILLLKPQASHCHASLTPTSFIAPCQQKSVSGRHRFCQGFMVFVFKDGLAISPGLDRRWLTGPDQDVPELLP